MYKGKANLKREQKKKSFPKSIVVITAVIVSLIILLSVISFTGLTEKEIFYKDIEIKDGQTLWEIAESEFGKDNDIRKYVYQIKQINNIKDVNLQPGQIIKVPIDKKV